MKKTYKYYFYKYCIGGLLGFLLPIAGINMWEIEFWIVLMPILFFNTFKDNYFNKINNEK